MPLIVDTYNVLHTVGILPPDLAGIDTQGLIGLMNRSRYRQEKTTLVCDGIPHDQAPTGRFGPIIIRYAGSNRLADDVICDLINQSSFPRRLTIVSSDHEIIKAARRRRCQTLSSKQFLGHLSHDASVEPLPGQTSRPTNPLKSEEIEQWTSEFGVDESEIELDLPDLPTSIAATQPPPVEPLSKAEVETPPKEQAGPLPGVGLPPNILKEAEHMIEEDDSPDSPPDADQDS